MSFVYLDGFGLLWSRVLELVFLRRIPENGFVRWRDVEILHNTPEMKSDKDKPVSSKLGRSCAAQARRRGHALYPNWKSIDSTDRSVQGDLQREMEQSACAREKDGEDNCSP
jgi:hypothetical protein